MAIWHVENPERGSKWGDWWQVFEKDGWEDGMTLRRWERSKYDAKTELRHTQNRYEVWDKEKLQYEEKHVRSPELRSYSVEQMSEMLISAGFLNVHSLSVESEGPASDDESLFYALGSK